jgi:glycosyltransferase involved in cell wall biosynthesis
MTPHAIELTLLMPCLDEAESVSECVQTGIEFLEREGVAGEILVVDNGSTDGSGELAAAAGARVVLEPRRGYGSALRRGIREARGRFVIMADADGSYDLSALDVFMDALREGTTLVVGNRFKGGIAAGAMPPLHRYLGNPVLSAVGKVFFGSPVGDFHCGIRGFSRAEILALNLSSDGMEFASEMVVRATLAGLSIMEVPTTLSPARRTKPPHLRSWRDGWRHLRYLLLLSPRWLFLYPGLAMFLGGLLTMAWLLPGPRTIGSVTFDVNTLVFSSAALSLGSQALAFAVLAKAFGVRIGILQKDPRIEWLTRAPVLEAMVGLGTLFFCIGFAGGVLAVGGWGQAGFGDLDPVRSLRLAIPSATAMVLGVQVSLAGFFFGVLDLKGDGDRGGSRPPQGN